LEKAVKDVIKRKEEIEKQEKKQHEDLQKEQQAKSEYNAKLLTRSNKLATMGIVHDFENKSFTGFEMVFAETDIMALDDAKFASDMDILAERIEKYKNTQKEIKDQQEKKEFQSKSEKEQVLALADSIAAIELPILASQAGISLVSAVKTMQHKMVAYIKEKAEKL